MNGYFLLFIFFWTGWFMRGRCGASEDACNGCNIESKNDLHVVEVNVFVDLTFCKQRKHLMFSLIYPPSRVPPHSRYILESWVKTFVHLSTTKKIYEKEKKKRNRQSSVIIISFTTQANSIRLVLPLVKVVVMLLLLLHLSFPFSLLTLMITFPQFFLIIIFFYLNGT